MMPPGLSASQKRIRVKKEVRMDFERQHREEKEEDNWRFFFVLKS